MKNNHFDNDFRRYQNEELALNFFDPHEQLRHAEIGVKLAEDAFRGYNTVVARKLVEEFFQLDPQKNQYYCRAKILLGLIIHDEAKEMNGPLSIQKRKEATEEILQALEVAVSPANISRYQFVVYNCSLAFWTVSRGFLRKGRARNFALSFEKVSNALEQQDDKDKDWRIHMLTATAYCFHDDNNIKAASDLVDKAIILTESLVNITSTEEKKVESLLQACKKRVDDLMGAFREIEDREELIRKPRKIDPDLPPDDEYYTRPIEYPPLQGLAAEGKEKVKSLLDLSQADKSKLEIKMRSITDLMKTQTEALIRYHRQRIAVNVADAKRYITQPSVMKDLRTSSLAQLQCIFSSIIVDKEIETTLGAIVKKLEDSPPSENRSETLLDVSRACWILGFTSLALKCMETVSTSSTPISRVLRIKLDICEAQSIVKQIDETTLEKAVENSLSSKHIDGIKIAKRLEAIKILERTLVMSVPLVDDKFLIQEMCIIMWNAMVPLFTKKLRLKIHSALKSMTTSLETIDCDFLAFLRSQIHYELALCEDASDYAGLALDEIQKSYQQDYGDVNPLHTRPLHDKESFDLNRVRDQYLYPLKVALSLRVNVYNTPSLLDDQVILWLQQAKESSSKSFVKEMTTKAGVLLFREMDNEGYGLKCGESGHVDWSIEVLKLGDLNITPIGLDEIENILQHSPRQEIFTYSLNKRLNNLMTLAELAYSIQETNCLQRACFNLLSFKWDISSAFAKTLMEYQIKCCCFLAESFVYRIQAEVNSQALPKTKGRKSNAHQDITKYCSLGLSSSNLPDDIIRMKKMAIFSLKKGLTLSFELKDIYLIQNVLIYFWNLHIHIVRKSYFDQVLDEVVDFLKLVTISADSYVTFARSGDSLDPRLILFYFEALGSIYYAKGNVVDALSQMTKALQINFSSISVNSSHNAYLRKNVIENGSLYNVAHALRSSAPNTKGKDAVVAGPLVQADNPLLNVFAALAVAESDSARNLPVSPDLVAESLDKACKIMLQEVPVMIQREESQEESKQVLKTKENKNLRLEMLLECYSRLSRLRTLRGDFVGAQDWSELGLKKFYSWNVGSRVEEEGMDLELKEEGSSKIFRWISNCEQCMALAIFSFLDASKQSKKSGNTAQASLDPELVSRLQFVALEHLRPSVHYSVLAGEEILTVKGGKLASVLLQELLAQESYQISALEISQHIISDLIQMRESRECQIILQSIYLSMITSLVLRKEYDYCLKLIKSAFSVIDTDLQKDLWPARVICMSRKGMNVLDGLQKLKEKDPLLQSRVLILFARSTKDLATKFSVFMQAIEMLDGYSEKVEYLLELSEVMSISGMPRAEIKNVLRLAISNISSVEENEYDDIKEWDEDDEKFGKESAVSRAKSIATSKTKLTTAKTTVSKRMSAAPSAKTATANSSNRSEEKYLEIDFRILDQAIRAYCMLIRVEPNFQQKTQFSSKAVYYVKRCLEQWIEILRSSYKHAQYSNIQGDTKVDFLEFNCDFPSHLIIPTSSMELFQWANSLNIRNATWDLVIDNPLKLPSLQALPSFAATIANLFFLIENLLEFHLYDSALYVVAFTKLLLWTTPAKPDLKPHRTPEDRKVPLLALQFLTMNIVAKLGMDMVSIFREMNFIIDDEENMCSPGTFIHNFISESNRKYFSQDINRDALFDLAYQDIIKHIHQAGPQPQPFDIDTTAKFFDSMISLDESYYWSKACGMLINLGLYDRTEHILLCLLWESRKRRDATQFATITGLLLKLQYSQGEFESCSIIALRQREILQYVGDCELFKSHFINALRSYYALNLVEEAKQLYHIVIKLIQDLARRKIEKPIIGGIKTDQRPTTTASELKVQSTLNASQSKVTITSQTSRVSKNDKTFISNEAGWEYMDTWKSISLHFIDISMNELLNKLTVAVDTKESGSSKEDILTLFRVIDEIFETSLSSIKEVIGESSVWELEMNVLRARKTSEFFHVLSRVYVRNHVEHYENVESAHSITAINFYQKSLQIARTWMESFTNFSRKYQMPNISSSLIDISSESVLIVDPLQMNNFQADTATCCQEIAINRIYGLAIFETGLAQLSRIIQLGRYKSPTDFKKLTLQKPNVVEKYLVETACPTELVQAELEKPDAVELYDSMAVASGYLRATKFSVFSELAAISALIAYYTNDMRFDAAWIPSEQKELLNELKYSSVNQSCAAWQILLMEKLTAIMDTDLNNFEDLIAGSITILLESLGCQRPQDSARFLIWLQSLKAKWWLHGLWSKSLDRRSQTSISLARIDHFLKCDFPSSDQSKLYCQEKDYLKTLSPSFSRLSIAQDPFSILPLFEQNHPNTYLMWIQCCPYQRTLYITSYKCASAPAVENNVKGGKPPAKEPAPLLETGKQWFFNKMDLNDQKRRALQILLQQQNDWKQDLSKFLAVYGEHMSDTYDEMEEEVPRQLNPSQKYERALDERFRAIMQDFETLFQEILGVDSSLSRFFQETSKSVDTKPSLCLMVDSNLQFLPWEGINLLDQTFNGHICRDFSFHLMHHRLNTNLSNGGAVINGPGIKLLIDPWGEDNQIENNSGNLNSLERRNFKEFWTSTLQAIRSPSVTTSKWQHLRDSNGLLSGEDFSLSFDASSNIAASHGKSHALIVNCFGRFGSILSPKLLASMDVGKLSFVACLEGGHCENSFRRQNSTDVLKGRDELELEESINICALLSLAGTSTLSTSLWPSPIKFQHRFAAHMLKALTDPKKEKVLSCVNSHSVDGIKLKRWIKYSKVLYGIGTLTYSDA